MLTAGFPAVVSADRLVETVWDGEPPATALRSLEAHVVRLRSALEPGRPRSSPGPYVLRRGTGYVLAIPRQAGFAAGALLAGVLADFFSIRTAVWVVAGLTAASGVLAAVRTHETHRQPVRTSDVDPPADDRR